MATIQVRNIPDDVHRVYRERSSAAGMSLQEYVLAELVHHGRTRTPAELMAEVEERLRAQRGVGFARQSSAEVIHADRSSH